MATEKKPRAQAWHIAFTLAALTVSADAAAAPSSQDLLSGDRDGYRRAGQAQNADTSSQGPQTWGKYTENLGYRIVNTDVGTSNLSIYTCKGGT